MNPKYLIDKYAELNKLEMQEMLLKKKQASLNTDVSSSLKTINSKRSSIKKDIIKFLEIEIQTLRKELQE